MPATTRPSDRRSRATRALASSSGWRSAGTATLVTSSRSPLDSTTAVSAVSPSSQGPANSTWSFAPSDPNPASRAARAAPVRRESESPLAVEVQLRQVQPQVHLAHCGPRRGLSSRGDETPAAHPRPDAPAAILLGRRPCARRCRSSQPTIAGHAGVRRHADRRPRAVDARGDVVRLPLAARRPADRAGAARRRTAAGLDDLGHRLSVQVTASDGTGDTGADLGRDRAGRSRPR